MSKIKVNSIEAATGSTITIPSGQTLDISATTLTLPSTVVTTTGTQTLTNKTIGVSQLSGTLPVANGGTGLTALGSASQVLRVNSGATALEFGTVSAGAILQVVQSLDGSTYEISTVSAQGAVTGTAISGLTTTLTPSSASSKILLMASVHFVGHSDYMQYANFTYQIGAGTEYAITSSGTKGVSMRFDEENPTSSDIPGAKALNVLFEPNTTSQITFRVRVAKSVSPSTNIFINRTRNNNTNDDDGGYTLSSFTVMELAGSSSSVTNTSVNTIKT
jgi:hypothetical protein